MSEAIRNTEYRFISADPAEVLQDLTTAYEQITGKTLRPASAEKIFLSWVASVIAGERNLINYTGNQNIPSRATGANLDALGDGIYGMSRPAATAAKTTIRFYISVAQASPILVPEGTRVTTESGEPVFATVEDVYIAAGSTYAEVDAECLTTGTSGNGYEAGQLNQCVDLYQYYDHCQNTISTAGGTDIPDDDEYYDLLVASMDAMPTTGSEQSYIYHTKKVSPEIVDVVVNTPSDGVVKIYAITGSGAASSGLKALILAACNKEMIRPLTDHLYVDDPTAVTYNITATYYQSTSSTQSAAELAAAIDDAVAEYVSWQSGKLGRDINPDKLRQLMMNAGAKRVVITYPVFTSLDDGRGTPVVAPDLAKVGTISITNGGYEDE